jgi:hypothetical protein
MAAKSSKQKDETIWHQRGDTEDLLILPAYRLCLHRPKQAEGNFIESSVKRKDEKGRKEIHILRL